MLHGLIIGIDRYRDSAISPLHYAKRDAEAVAALLAELAPDGHDLELLRDAEATRENIDAAVMQRLRSGVARGDTVVIFLAGHGTQEVRAGTAPLTHYFVPHDAVHADLHGSAIDMEHHLGVWLQQLDYARRVYLFLDSCFSGQSGGRTFHSPLFFSDPLRYLDVPSERAFQRVHLGSGRVILCAADADEVAREEHALQHGLFTHQLLRALRTPRPDGVIDIGDLYKEVARGVREASGGRQNPVIHVRSGREPRFPAFRSR